MRIKLRPLAEQVVVITGGSSGIGLVTGRAAAKRGAAVVLAARNADDVRRAADVIRADGGRAIGVPADVSRQEDMERLAQAAIDAFGHIDTWVNNAGLSVYGATLEVPTSDERRLFDTNYWGVVHGCRAAVPHLRRRGGALINMGSIVSDRAAPLQAAYVASKHAIKGYTDTLRMELEKDRAPISVTLVKPAGIDTPFFEHARSYMVDGEPKPPPPVYAPDAVAEAVLRAAEEPVRDVTVGGAGRFMTFLGTVAPRLSDLYMETLMFAGQQDRSRPADLREGNLEAPLPDGQMRGRYEGPVLKRSAYTRAALSDVGRALPYLALGFAGWAFLRGLGVPRSAGAGA